MRAAQFASVSSRCKSLQIIWDTNDRWISVSCDISRTVLWVCGLSSWLRTKSLIVSTFSSVRGYGHTLMVKVNKQKDMTRKILLTISMEKDRYFKHRKYQNLWMNNKEATKKCTLFAFSATSAENLNFCVSQGSVATCLRWDGYGFYSKFHTLSSRVKISKIG